MADNTTTTPNGWNEWAKYVLLTLEEQNNTIKDLDSKIDDINVKLSVLQTKVTMRATALGALIPTLAYVVMWILKNINAI